MKPICEVMVQYVLPTMRAMVAKNLMEKHDFTQQEVAKTLGISQPAVSQYKRDLRGSRAKILQKDKAIQREAYTISNKIAAGGSSPHDISIEFCRVCDLLMKNSLETICELHKEVSPNLEDCNVCFENPSKALNC